MVGAVSVMSNIKINEHRHVFVNVYPDCVGLIAAADSLHGYDITVGLALYLSAVFACVFIGIYGSVLLAVYHDSDLFADGGIAEDAE